MNAVITRIRFGDLHPNHFFGKKKPSSPCYFSREEDKAIVAFLDEFKRHKFLEAPSSFAEMAKVDYFKRNERTGQGLQKRWRRHIHPNLSSLLNKDPDMLKRFEDGEALASDRLKWRPEPFRRLPARNWMPKQK